MLYIRSVPYLTQMLHDSRARAAVGLWPSKRLRVVLPVALRFVFCRRLWTSNFLIARASSSNSPVPVPLKDPSPVTKTSELKGKGDE